MPENFANNYQVTLATNMTSGSVTSDVSGIIGVPAVPFRGIISAEASNTNEIVLVTARNGTTLTMTRAVEAVAGVQVASSHNIGATFTAIITAAAMAPLAEVLDARGGYATLGSKVRSQVFDIRDYGAMVDGVTDDSAAVLAAVNAAASSTSGGLSSRGAVYFPPGICLVTANAVLTPTAVTTVPGIDFRGAGMYTSIIRWGTLGSDAWFYDNGATARNAFDTFSNLGFQGMNPASFSVYTNIPTQANGFKITSAGNEQGFRFNNCQFAYLNTAFQMLGTNTASEMKFFGCRIAAIRSTVYDINNSQSFNHEFFGCDVETIYGNVFSIGPLGGGAIKIFGGSWIMSPGPASNKFFLTASGSSGPAASPFICVGARFEFRGNYANLTNLGATLQLDLAFENCLMFTIATADLTAFCNAPAYTTIAFRKCTFYEGSTGQFRFVVGGASSYTSEGTIEFDHCALPVDWSDRCSIFQYFGVIRATGCYGLNITSASGAFWAHDFDWHFTQTAGQSLTGGSFDGGGAPSDNLLRLKVAQMKLVTDFWPANTEFTLKLPRNAIIKNIHLRKPAGGADATVTTMIVGRNDKTGTPHLTSNSAADSAAHTGDQTNYFYHVGTTTNERTLRLYASAATSGAVQGGLVIVEYY